MNAFAKSRGRKPVLALAALALVATLGGVAGAHGNKHPNGRATALTATADTVNGNDAVTLAWTAPSQNGVPGRQIKAWEIRRGHMNDAAYVAADGPHDHRFGRRYLATVRVANNTPTVEYTDTSGLDTRRTYRYNVRPQYDVPNTNKAHFGKWQKVFFDCC